MLLVVAALMGDGRLDALIGVLGAEVQDCIDSCDVWRATQVCKKC